MRTATSVLLVRARSSGLREFQASFKTDCKTFRVSGVNASIFVLTTYCYRRATDNRRSQTRASHFKLLICRISVVVLSRNQATEHTLVPIHQRSRSNANTKQKDSFDCHGRDACGQRDKRIRARKRRERWRQCIHERGHEWGHERQHEQRCPSFGDTGHRRHRHSRHPLPINDAYSAVQR